MQRKLGCFSSGQSDFERFNLLFRQPLLTGTPNRVGIGILTERRVLSVKAGQDRVVIEVMKMHSVRQADHDTEVSRMPVTSGNSPAVDLP